MKICWDNLDKISYNGRFYILNKKGKKRYLYYNDSCSYCKNEFLGYRKISKHCSISCVNKERIFTQKHKNNISKALKGKFNGNNNPNYKGGYHLKNLPSFERFKSQLSYIEEIRRSSKDKNILEVKCIYCGKWFIPKRTECESRVNAINGHTKGELRFYCSDDCKNNCSIYKRSKYQKGFEPISSREVQPELRQIVFGRDKWTCQKCGKYGGKLHCHHITGVELNPIESADIDNCITLCKDCHKWIHKNIPGCGYNDLRCK